MVSKNTDYDASNIIVLEGLEAVRKVPGMYIGGTSTSGMNHLVYEIVDNAVDEHMAGVCSRIVVSFMKDGSVSVSDNGRGVPVDRHKSGVSAERVIFTQLHAGGKFDNSAYQTSGGLHGVGSSVVNALSEWMNVDVSKNGKVYSDSYQRGIPVIKLNNGLLPVTGTATENGTTVSFLPDKEIFENAKFDISAIKNRLHEIAYLNPGLIIEFHNYRQNEEEDLVYQENDGISAYVQELNRGKNPVHDVIRFQGKNEDIAVEIAFQFVDTFEEKVLGYCNTIVTPNGGTHLTGFKTRFTSLINSYARELGILKEKDANFTGADTRCGMTAVVSVRHKDPIFEGQTKMKLGSSDAARATAYVTGEQLTLYFDKHLEDLKSIIGCAEKSAKIRRETEKAKTGLITKSRFSFDGNGKLANCESKDASKCEIFIVEGDSAGGSAKTARDRKYQAILPIRGKILNVEKASMDKVLANAEIKTMIQAFGCGFSEGYGNDFDISKLRYNRIIIMTDADVDGDHISTLLLTFFYRFMPDLISDGHIYLAMPPLYQAVPQKGKRKYLYDDADLAKYRKAHKGFTLQRYKGLGEMDPEQLWETTMNPENRILKQVNIEDFYIADGVTEVLMGNNVENRKDFIYQHADEAKLDV